MAFQAPLEFRNPFFYCLTLKMKGLRSIETYVATGFSVYDTVNTLVTASGPRPFSAYVGPVNTT